MHQVPGGYHNGTPKKKTLAGILKNVMPASFFLHFVRYPFDTLEITAKVCLELVSGLSPLDQLLLLIHCKKNFLPFLVMEYSNFTMFTLATKCVLKSTPCLFVVCLMCFHLLSIDLF
jgi:hypothetical protein